VTRSSLEADIALQAMVARVVAHEAAQLSSEPTAQAIELLVLIRDGFTSQAVIVEDGE